jgi:hypothetical protein
MVPPPPTMIIDVVCCELDIVEFGVGMGSSVSRILVLEVVVRQIHDGFFFSPSVPCYLRRINPSRKRM